MSITNMSAAPHAIAAAARDGISLVRMKLHRALPMGGLVVALLANVAWIAVLVYGLSALF